MSTRSSIVWSDDLHFYTDLMDEDDGLYLQLRGPDVQFSASPGGVTVKIPAHVWQVIRQHSLDLSLADKSDEELRAIVEADVDKRLDEYKAAKGKRGKALASLFGFSLYGDASSSRETQVAAGMAYYEKARKQQVEIVEKAKTLKIRD